MRLGHDALRNRKRFMPIFADLADFTTMRFGSVLDTVVRQVYSIWWHQIGPREVSSQDITTGLQEGKCFIVVHTLAVKNSLKPLSLPAYPPIRRSLLV